MIRAVTVAVALAACGGGQSSGRAMTAVEDWDCAKRTAEYALVGGFVAAESGITVACAGDRAFLDNWRVDSAGKRSSTRHELGQFEFEELWSKLESAGWRNLSDCDNPDAAGDDPVYTIVISDDAGEVSLTCQGKGELPFPYNRLVNELDLKAAGFSQ